MAIWAPLPMVRLGTHAVPAFSVLGAAGIVVGALAGWWLGLTIGMDRATLGAATIAAVLALIVDIVAQAAVRGYVNLIAMREAGLSLAAAALACLIVGRPVAPVLDVSAVAVVVVLAFGRIGCVAGGCCYGRPAPYGIRYRPAHVPGGFPEHLVGVVLWPSQLVEAAGLSALAIVGAVLTLSAHAGAVGAIALGYALLRAALEPTRGDRIASPAYPLTAPQYCAAGVAAAAVLGVATRWLPSWQVWPALAVLALVAASAALGRVTRTRTAPHRGAARSAHRAGAPDHRARSARG